MKRILLPILTLIVAWACSEPPIPTLEISYTGECIIFTPQALESERRTIEVSTNQELWDAKSDKDWCIITKAENYFIVSAKPNNSSIAVPDATITITAGEATPIKIKVTQESIFLSCEPLDGWDIPEEGETRKLTIVCNSSWTIKADNDWITFSQTTGEGYAEIDVTIAATNEDIVTTNKITVTCGDLKKEIHITRDYKHVSYAIGDLYPDSENPIGVVYRGGKSGRIVALTGAHRAYSYYYEFSEASNYSDGRENMKAVKENSSLSAYPAFNYCNSFGENWYFPAYLEVHEIYNSYDIINESITKAGGTTIGSSIASSTENGYSQYYIVTYDGNTTHQKTMDKQTQVHTRAVMSY